MHRLPMPINVPECAHAHILSLCVSCCLCVGEHPPPNLRVCARAQLSREESVDGYHTGQLWAAHDNGSIVGCAKLPILSFRSGLLRRAAHSTLHLTPSSRAVSACMSTRGYDPFH